MEQVISVDLARRLLSAGLIWEPRPGDRFVVPDRDMDDDVFVVSNMTVDVHDFPDGRVIGFNGTTEWALDSLELTEVLWLPSETRLREELGERFVALQRADDRWLVRIVHDGEPVEFTDTDTESAYAKALLSVLDFG